MAILFIISGLFLLTFFPFSFRKKWIEIKSTPLLPNFFIYPAIITLLGCIIAPAIIEINEVATLSELRNLFIILALGMICFSREKIENENTNMIRIQSLVLSFITLTIIYQIFLIFNFLEIRNISGAQLPICILAMYLLIFHLNKRRLINK